MEQDVAMRLRPSRGTDAHETLRGRVEAVATTQTDKESPP